MDLKTPMAELQSWMIERGLDPSRYRLTITGADSEAYCRLDAAVKMETSPLDMPFARDKPFEIAGMEFKIARQQRRTICGACGQPWQEGMACGQKFNGHPFLTCYPAEVEA